MTTAREDAALLDLLEVLRRRDYRFVTPLNSTHRIVRARADKLVAHDLRDVLGWSLPFRRGSIDPEVEALLAEAGCLADAPRGCEATVRVSTVQGRLFLHSAYPPREADAVFLGPDTYRFAEFLRVELAGADLGHARVFDVGAGAGVGGIHAAALTGARDVVLSDVNPDALRFAAINAAHAGVPVRTRLAAGLDGVAEAFDLIVSNPPFIAAANKTYSDGGGTQGTELSRTWAKQAMPRLRPGGRLLMYSGAPIVAGGDALREALEAAAADHGLQLSYRELDPDIFGAQLKRRVYADVERIAAVGAVVARSR